MADNEVEAAALRACGRRQPCAPCPGFIADLDNTADSKLVSELKSVLSQQIQRNRPWSWRFQVLGVGTLCAPSEFLTKTREDAKNPSFCIALHRAAIDIVELLYCRPRL
jgi:hypothetical protein